MTDKEPHGNSKESQKPQHVYSIHDATNDDQVVKFGISGQELNKDDTSPRANEQVRKWNGWAGIKRFWAKILQKNIDGREQALEIEKELVKNFKDEHGRMPSEQKRPKPE